MLFRSYLGTIEQSTPGDIAAWTVAVATTDLAFIPHRIGYKVGGVELEADLMARTWIRSPLYSSDKLPRPVQKYQPPPAKSEEVVPLPRRVIHDLCRGRDPNTLPEEVRRLLADDGPEVVPETQNAQRPIRLLQRQVTNDRQPPNSTTTRDKPTQKEDAVGGQLGSIPSSENGEGNRETGQNNTSNDSLHLPTQRLGESQPRAMQRAQATRPSSSEKSKELNSENRTLCDLPRERTMLLDKRSGANLSRRRRRARSLSRPPGWKGDESHHVATPRQKRKSVILEQAQGNEAHNGDSGASKNSERPDRKSVV